MNRAEVASATIRQCLILPGMAYLDKLPEELLAHILRYLEDNALNNVSRVNKRFKRIADAYLYWGVAICEEGKYHALMRSAARNPDLATNIRLIFTMTPKCDCGNTEFQEDFLKVLRSATFIKRLEILRFVSDRPREISDPSETEWLRLFEEATNRTVAPSTNPFSHLHWLSIADTCYSIWEMRSLFSLPSLSCLILDTVHQTDPMEHWTVPESSSSIKTLAIRSSNINNTALIKMISCVKSLTKLEYSPCNDPWSVEESDPALPWDMLGNVLRRHKVTLKELTLLTGSNEYVAATTSASDGNSTTLGCMSDFAVLQTLTVPFHRIVEVSVDDNDMSKCLPGGLQYLCLPTVLPIRLAEYLPTAIESLKNVLTSGPEPRFDLILLAGFPFRQSGTLDALESLQNEGVELSICTASFDGGYQEHTVAMLMVAAYMFDADYGLQDVESSAGEEDENDEVEENQSDSDMSSSESSDDE